MSNLWNVNLTCWCTSTYLLNIKVPDLCCKPFKLNFMLYFASFFNVFSILAVTQQRRKSPKNRLSPPSSCHPPLFRNISIFNEKECHSATIPPSTKPRGQFSNPFQLLQHYPLIQAYQTLVVLVPTQTATLRLRRTCQLAQTRRTMTEVEGAAWLQRVLTDLRIWGLRPWRVRRLSWCLPVRPRLHLHQGLFLIKEN